MKRTSVNTVVIENNIEIRRVNRFVVSYKELSTKRELEIEVEAGYDSLKTLNIYLSNVNFWNQGGNQIPLLDNDISIVRVNLQNNVSFI